MQQLLIVRVAEGGGAVLGAVAGVDNQGAVVCEGVGLELGGPEGG